MRGVWWSTGERGQKEKSQQQGNSPYKVALLWLHCVSVGRTRRGGELNKTDSTRQRRPSRVPAAGALGQRGDRSLAVPKSFAGAEHQVPRDRPLFWFVFLLFQFLGYLSFLLAVKEIKRGCDLCSCVFATPDSHPDRGKNNRIIN